MYEFMLSSICDIYIRNTQTARDIVSKYGKESFRQLVTDKY